MKLSGLGTSQEMLFNKMCSAVEHGVYSFIADEKGRKAGEHETFLIYNSSKS